MPGLRAAETRLRREGGRDQGRVNLQTTARLAVENRERGREMRQHPFRMSANVGEVAEVGEAALVISTEAETAAQDSAAIVTRARKLREQYARTRA